MNNIIKKMALVTILTIVVVCAVGCNPSSATSATATAGKSSIYVHIIDKIMSCKNVDFFDELSNQKITGYNEKNVSVISSFDSKTIIFVDKTADHAFCVSTKFSSAPREFTLYTNSDKTQGVVYTLTVN